MEVSKADGLVMTFSGGAWYQAFYFGVGAAVADFLLDRNDKDVRFCGVSCGGLVAVGLAHDLDMHSLFEESLQVLPRTRKNFLGVLKYCEDVLNRVMAPDETWQAQSLQKRLLVGVSVGSLLCPCLNPKTVHNFLDRAHGIAVLQGSMHLPGLGSLAGHPVGGERFYDGCFTLNWKNLPVFKEEEPSWYPAHVIRITCHHDASFADVREGWITPQLQFPMLWQLVPPSENHLRRMWRLGYLRFVEYLNRFADAPGIRGRFACSRAKEASYSKEISSLVDSFLTDAKVACCSTPYNHMRERSSPSVRQLF